MSNEKTESLLQEILDLLKSIKASNAPSSQRSPSSNTDEEKVKDVVSEQPWFSTEMPFSKHRGTTLGEMPTGMVKWMAKNWTSKGYDTDKDLQLMIDAVCGSKDPLQGISTANTQQTNTTPAPDLDADVPF